LLLLLLLITITIAMTCYLLLLSLHPLPAAAHLSLCTDILARLLLARTPIHCPILESFGLCLLSTPDMQTILLQAKYNTNPLGCSCSLPHHAHTLSKETKQLSQTRPESNMETGQVEN